MILAGGASTRMGRPKPLLDLAGQSILERVRSKLDTICSEIILVTHKPTDFIDCDLKIVQDLVPVRGPLGGLATGLFYAQYQWAIVLACDLPFLKLELLNLLARQALASPQGPRAVIPYHAAGWEPLVAAYSKACYKITRRLLDKGNASLLDLKDNGVPFQIIPEEDLREIDPDLSSFNNLNTPEDLARAREIFSKN
ncbi:MAG: molybdenum cofactor guanylyltransferase [Candidatus Adiutricales bacterium]